MFSFSRVLIIGSALLTLGLHLYAHDPYHRKDRDSRDRDRRNRNNRDDAYRGGRYGRGSGSLVGQVVSDLQRASSGARFDDHERKHFEKAISSLREFQDKQAQGKFDTGKLDKAIKEMEHLAQAEQLRGRDRDMIAGDLQDLRQYRSTRGQSAGGRYGGYRDDPYYGGR